MDGEGGKLSNQTLSSVVGSLAGLIIQRNLAQGGRLKFPSLGITVEGDPLQNHRCRPVARLLMAEGRDWWLGELLEPLPGYPQETHCLHLKTPVKEVVFGVNRADMEQLAILCHIVCGPIDLQWLDSMAQLVKQKAQVE